MSIWDGRVRGRYVVLHLRAKCTLAYLEHTSRLWNCSKRRRFTGRSLRGQGNGSERRVWVGLGERKGRVSCCDRRDYEDMRNEGTIV